MADWAEVDRIRVRLQNQAAADRAERKHLRRANDYTRDGIRGRRPIIRHVARVPLAYTCKTKRGELREMAPGDLWNKTFGAAALKGLTLRALCGDLRANDEKGLNRTTCRVKYIACDACRVALDAELEAGRRLVNDRGSLEYPVPR